MRRDDRTATQNTVLAQPKPEFLSTTAPFKARRDLERIKIEAEQKIATAQAEARSLALQRDAITSNLIELRRIEAQRLAIEKWDGRLPITMLGNSTPFVDVSQLSNRR